MVVARRNNMKTISALEIQSESVYTTKNCKVRQCDTNNSFFVTIWGETMEMKVCSLLIFKQRIFKIDLENLLLEDHNQGIEIVNFNCHNRVFVFNATEVIELRNLLEGTLAMLEMNSMIQATQRRRFF